MRTCASGRGERIGERARRALSAAEPGALLRACASRYLGVRTRDDWSDRSARWSAASRARGTPRVRRSPTPTPLHRLGSCLQGCPTNAGKSTRETPTSRTHGWRAARAAPGDLAGSGADRGSATAPPRPPGWLPRSGRSVASVGGRRGGRGRGTLNTPGLLARLGLEDPLIGRTRLPPAGVLVFGPASTWPQDAHVVYPITSHCADHRATRTAASSSRAVRSGSDRLRATSRTSAGRCGARRCRGAAAVSPLDRAARDGQRRQQRRPSFGSQPG